MWRSNQAQQGEGRMCRKGLTWAVTPLLAGLASPALPQSADLSGATCAAYLEQPAGDRRQFGLWLHGYYAGAAQRPAIDRDKLQAALDAIEKACERNGAMPLIGAEARSLFLGEAASQPTPAAPQPETQPRPAPAAPSRPTPLR